VTGPDYAHSALGWIANGASIVGGCCGTSIAHIRALRSALAV
jgi:S-methylmethionine-dependent homocysteine/selenocysteine methylase